MFTEYLDFKLQISSLGPGNYLVHVGGPGGDASTTITIATNDETYQALAARLQQLDTDETTLIDLGQILFRALFQGSIKDVYVRSQGRLEPHQGLRLLFEIDPTATTIAALPWEFLADPDQGPITMLDAPIVRYLPHQAVVPRLATSLPLKVLITSVQSPPAFNVQYELDEVQAAFAALGNAAHITVEPHLTRQKFMRHLRNGYHVWHFIGHGGFTPDGSTGTLLFEDDSGNSSAISAIELNILLNRSGVRLVVLDACDSAKLMTDPLRSIAPALVRAHIPAVVAMQFPVPTETTRAFASEFYRALVEGFPIDACVTEGRRAVMGVTGLGRADWGIPVVYTRAPDGKLFELPDRPTSAPRPTSTTRPAEPPTQPVLTPKPMGILRIPLEMTHSPIENESDNAQLPFVVGPPIAHPQCFFGRGREVKRIFSMLKRTPLQNTAIIGARRSGKTSLLHYLRRITRTPLSQLRADQRSDWLSDPERYRWVFIDFQDPRLGHRDALLRYILAQLNLAAPEQCDIDYFLDTLSGNLQQPTILLFDEIGVALERYTELDNGFWESFRALATNQADGNLAFVLAAHASPTTLARETGRSSPFFNIFGYTATLGPLTETEAHALIASSPIRIPETDVAWILEQSQRWPILVQLLCRERLAALDDGETGDGWREEAMRQLSTFQHLLEAQ